MLVPVLNVYFPVKTLISLGWINHDESLSEKKKKKIPPQWGIKPCTFWSADKHTNNCYTVAPGFVSLKQAVVNLDVKIVFVTL